MTDGDIYRWKYNEATLKTKDDGNNGGTTYWCVSQIGIWREDRGYLEDTYWGSNSNHTFNQTDIDAKLILTFIANINDLEAVSGRYVFNNYDDKDCINITHANMMSGGFYIKKGALPSIDKKRRVLEAHIQYTEGRVKSMNYDIASWQKDLANLKSDSFVPYSEKVYVKEER